MAKEATTQLKGRNHATHEMRAELASALRSCKQEVDPSPEPRISLRLPIAFVNSQIRCRPRYALGGSVATCWRIALPLAPFLSLCHTQSRPRSSNGDAAGLHMLVNESPLNPNVGQISGTLWNSIPFSKPLRYR
jgi:hypothetical protein